MYVRQEIIDRSRRIELLAPAGTRAALEAVLEAGADAVYLSPKRLQMRAHRPEMNFDAAGIEMPAAARAVWVTGAAPAGAPDDGEEVTGTA